MYKRFFVIITVIMIALCGCARERTTEDKSAINDTFKRDIEMFEQQSTETTEVTTTNITKIDDALGALHGKVILIDAGHGKADYSKKEPVAPGSSEMKAAFVAGTSGKNQTEAELNLKVAKKLQDRLKVYGAEVHMTRTGATTDKSNVDRAKMGNRLKADITVRIHANGSEDSSVKGILTMVPGEKYVTEEVREKSYKAGLIIQKHMIAETGAVDGGIQERNDLTGFNWSEVPVVLVEMGFMTNPDEDKLLEDSAYQDKIVNGIADGLLEYF